MVFCLLSLLPFLFPFHPSFLLLHHTSSSQALPLQLGLFLLVQGSGILPHRLRAKAEDPHKSQSFTQQGLTCPGHTYCPLSDCMVSEWLRTQVTHPHKALPFLWLTILGTHLWVRPDTTARTASPTPQSSSPVNTHYLTDCTQHSNTQIQQGRH